MLGPLNKSNCPSMFQSSVNTCLGSAGTEDVLPALLKKKQINEKPFKGNFHILSQLTNGHKCQEPHIVLLYKANKPKALQRMYSGLIWT